MTNFGCWIEGQAIGLRQLGGLGRAEKLDPWAFATALGVLVCFPEDIDGLSTLHVERLAALPGRTWSGASSVLPNGMLAVILNPLHARTRNAVTILEEIAHEYLGHTPSLAPSAALAVRDFRAGDEKQAYGVAAAAILPSARLSLLQGQCLSEAEIAAEDKVSPELVK